MGMIRIATGTEQVADCLKKGLLQGKWKGAMPGRDKLAQQLGVNRKTVDSALQQLERDQFLVSQGPRRRRQISIPENHHEKRSMRIAILRILLVCLVSALPASAQLAPQAPPDHPPIEVPDNRTQAAELTAAVAPKHGDTSAPSSARSGAGTPRNANPPGPKTAGVGLRLTDNHPHRAVQVVQNGPGRYTVSDLHAAPLGCVRNIG